VKPPGALTRCSAPQPDATVKERAMSAPDFCGLPKGTLQADS